MRSYDPNDPRNRQGLVVLRSFMDHGSTWAAKWGAPIDHQRFEKRE